MKTNQTIKADSILFFDMDGTLIDTDYANFLSYKKAVEIVKKSEFNIAYNPRQRLTRSSLEIAIPNLTKKELEMIIDEKEKCYDDFLSETKLNNEIAEILDKYRKTNKTVLVTNCRKNRALTLLEHHRLTDTFSNLFFRQFDDENKKVNKFQNAILSLGISPDLVVAFENEDFEITEAQNAGIPSKNIIKIINP